MYYNVLVTEEAENDVFELVKYIAINLGNIDASNNLYNSLEKEIHTLGHFPLKHVDTGIRYRGYMIHKKVYQSYLLFYIINNTQKEVYVLRILKDLMNWQRILRKENKYHFTKNR